MNVPFSQFLKASGRRAFTLIELLVVIAIIATLVAILLPAVQSARSAARRTQNRNNLKQIGLALHNYHEAYGLLPSGWIGVEAGLPAIEGGSGFAWGAMILPFVDQAPLFDRFDFKLPVNDSANGGVGRSYLPVFRNPSDIGEATWDIVEEGNPGNVLATLPSANYVGNFGSGELEDCAGLMPGENCMGNGVFFHNSSVRFRDIVDGASNTFLVGERRSDQALGWHSTWLGAVPSGEEAATRVLGVCHHTPNAASDFDHFSSYDEGGVHFAFADGHVKFVSELVDLAVFQGLATRAGGEVVEGEF